MKIETKNAIEKAGSSTELASLMGVTKGAVSQWGEAMPEDQAKRLLEMRPDWYPDLSRQYVQSLQEKIGRIESAHLAPKAEI